MLLGQHWKLLYILFVVIDFPTPSRTCFANNDCDVFEFCNSDANCSPCSTCRLRPTCDQKTTEFCDLGCVEGFAERSGQCNASCPTSDGSRTVLPLDNLCIAGQVCCVDVTAAPTTRPTTSPSVLPMTLPTSNPSRAPSAYPTTSTPSLTPTQHPTQTPTHTITLHPTLTPSSNPPSSSPTRATPTTSPTSSPTPPPTPPTPFSQSTAPTNSSTTSNNTDAARSAIIGGVIAALVVVLLIVVVIVWCNRTSRGPFSKNVNPVVLNNFSLSDIVACEDDPNYITVVNDNTTFEIPLEDVDQTEETVQIETSDQIEQTFTTANSTATTNAIKDVDVGGDDDLLFPSDPELSIFSRALSIKSNVDSLGYQIPVVQSTTRDGDDHSIYNSNSNNNHNNNHNNNNNNDNNTKNDDDDFHDYTNIDDTAMAEAITVSLGLAITNNTNNTNITSIPNSKAPMYSAINKERAANLWDNIITRSSVLNPLSPTTTTTLSGNGDGDGGDDDDDVDNTNTPTTVNTSSNTTLYAPFISTPARNTNTANGVGDVIGERPRASTIPDRTSMIITTNATNTTNTTNAHQIQHTHNLHDTRTTNTTSSDVQHDDQSKHGLQSSVDADGYEIPVVNLSSAINNNHNTNNNNNNNNDRNNVGGLFEDHDYADAETIPDVVLPPLPPPPVSPVMIARSGQEREDQVV